MRGIAATGVLSGTLLLIGGDILQPGMATTDAIAVSRTAFVPQPVGRTTVGATTVGATTHSSSLSADDLTGVVAQYCQVCHNDVLLTGNLSLSGYDVDTASSAPEISERIIQKLRAAMMPPPGMPRPGGDTLDILAQTLEENMDEAAAAAPNPGGRSFQRLNRAEYERSIADLLDLEIEAGDYLPLDTKSANFDNIADVQLLSPTLLNAYLQGASEVARLAVGNTLAGNQETTYRIPRLASQRERAEGAPYGSRGGTSVIHNFPADGTYKLSVSFHYSPEGLLFGRNEPGEQVDISIDGEQVAVLPIDRFMGEVDPGGKGLTLETGPIPIRAGPHRVSAVFIPVERGPVDDLFSAHGHSILDTQIGIGYGLRMPPHIRDLVIKGPSKVTGISDTPSRRKIFTCRPTGPGETRPCAEEIVSRLGSVAYRRPLEDQDLRGLMGFYYNGEEEGGFEVGVRFAVEAMLASPHFIFRFEEWPEGVEPGEIYTVSDIDLASRLSFFLWASPPDAELRELAQEGKLSDDETLRAQTVRMLVDPRSEALSTRFALQWLRLSDLDKLNPDAVMFPDYDQQLAEGLKQETALFFEYMFREDRSVLEFITADYTFVNERLAGHYGIPDVVGEEFRMVQYPDDTRRGVFGHASVLAQTSLANRTSPVLRGKWVMEVVLGVPPPPPPPGVPDLEETESTEGTRMLTTRERMEKHRSNVVCNACHQFMDPIGLSLDNFDVTGRWRIRENGMPLDTRGALYDGTPLTNPADLHQALLRLKTPVLRNFTANLMAYGLGRRVEYFDMPTIRKIVAEAEREEYRASSFVLGIVESDAFRMRKAQEVVTDTNGSGN
jgi:hypothetical protein